MSGAFPKPDAPRGEAPGWGDRQRRRVMQIAIGGADEDYEGRDDRVEGRVETGRKSGAASFEVMTPEQRSRVARRRR